MLRDLKDRLLLKIADTAQKVSDRIYNDFTGGTSQTLSLQVNIDNALDRMEHFSRNGTAVSNSDELYALLSRTTFVSDKIGMSDQELADFWEFVMQDYSTDLMRSLELTSTKN